MTKCAMCSETAIAYAQLFEGRKKVKSYPVCIRHGISVYGFEQLAQDLLRTNLSGAFGIKKGSLPKVKVSLSP